MPPSVLALGQYLSGAVVGAYLGAGGHPTFRAAALVVTLGATWGARRSTARATGRARVAADGRHPSARRAPTELRRDDELLLVS